MSGTSASLAPLLFGFALFLSSVLLFAIQPLVGRTLLPHLGGNPLAWNACLVFFQTALCAGYVYASLFHRFRGMRWQPCLHLFLLAVAILLLFAGAFGDNLLLGLAPRLNSFDPFPILSTLALLIVVLGFPLLLLAAVGSLLQRWFAHLDHPKASDPYFLGVASNLGGLTALALYPMIIEPYAPLRSQWLAWKLALTALGVLVALAAFVVWRSPRNPELEPDDKPVDPNAPLLPKLIGRGPATASRKLLWFFASALPIALLMGVTQFLTLDVAPAPLLWVIPLAVYLFAFCQAFARYAPFQQESFGFRLLLQVGYGIALVGIVAISGLMLLGRNQGDDSDFAIFCVFLFGVFLAMPSAWLVYVQPTVALFLVFAHVNLFRQNQISTPAALLYVAGFYFSVRLCLERLANDRPAVTDLTVYFRWIGFGGLAGGLFALILVPWLFPTDYLEFAFFVALATTLRPAWLGNGWTDWLACKLLLARRDGAADDPAWLRPRVALGFDVGLAVLAVGSFVLWFLVRAEITPPVFGRGNWGDRNFVPLFADGPLILSLLSAALLIARPLRFGLALAGLVAFSWIGMDNPQKESLVFRERNPFGIVRVTEAKQDLRHQKGIPVNAKQASERKLMLGGVHHGSCITEPAELRRYPTGCYHPKSPFGQILRNLTWFHSPKAQPFQPAPAPLPGKEEFSRVDARIVASLFGAGGSPLAAPLDQLGVAWSEPPMAVIGLGTGTILTYAHPLQWVDVHELDPAILGLSDGEEPTFHYFRSARERGVAAHLIRGDGRRNLVRPGRENFYHVLVVDAFHSGAIPMHLLTREALGLYFQKLAPGGIVCIHTSNRYLNVAKVIENTARHLDLASTVVAAPAEADLPFSRESEWVFLARSDTVLRKWTLGAEMDQAVINGGFGFHPRLVWSDEHASLITAVRLDNGWVAMFYGMAVLLLLAGILMGAIEAYQACQTRSAGTPPPRDKRSIAKP